LLSSENKLQMWLSLDWNNSEGIWPYECLFGMMTDKNITPVISSTPQQRRLSAKLPITTARRKELQPYQMSSL